MSEFFEIKCSHKHVQSQRDLKKTTFQIMLYPPGKQNMRQNLEIIKTVFPFIDSMLKAVCTLGKKIPPPKNKNEHQQSIRFNTI